MKKILILKILGKLDFNFENHLYLLVYTAVRVIVQIIQICYERQMYFRKVGSRLSRQKVIFSVFLKFKSGINVRPQISSSGDYTF